jgi:hypothetical protein
MKLIQYSWRVDFADGNFIQGSSFNPLPRYWKVWIKRWHPKVSFEKAKFTRSEHDCKFGLTSIN